VRFRTAARERDELGVGADRVLIASGLIDEEDYVRALAASRGAMFEPLTDIPRAACPLTDDRLIEAAAVGLLPLEIGGGLVLVVAPRATAARRLAGLLATRRDLAHSFRFTSARHLQQFVVRHGHRYLGWRAADSLRSFCPDLSAAPRPGRRGLLTFAAIAALLLAAAAAAPGEVWAAVNALLAIIFIAWIALRLFGSLVKHPEAKSSARLSEDRLPVYTVVAALYREAASVEHLADCLRQLDYPALGSKCT
ncbi:MAG: glycosyl transferase, partial [Xanthobacteraceae bacterium]